MWNCAFPEITKRRNTQKLRWEYLVRKRISSSLVNPVLLKHIREILHYWVPTCNSLVISGQKVGWKKWDIWQKAEQLKMGSLWSLNPYGQLRVVGGCQLCTAAFLLPPPPPPTHPIIASIWLGQLFGHLNFCTQHTKSIGKRCQRQNILYLS